MYRIIFFGFFATCNPSGEVKYLKVDIRVAQQLLFSLYPLSIPEKPHEKYTTLKT